MEHEKVVKLRSSILDKLYKCDEIYHNTMKFESVMVIDHDKMDNLMTKKSIETIELCKSLIMFESDVEAISYLNTIKNPPCLIFLDEYFLNFLNTYHIDSAKTRVIILKASNITIEKDTLESIEKPLTISIIKDYFKI